MNARHLSLNSAVPTTLELPDQVFGAQLPPNIQLAPNLQRDRARRRNTRISQIWTFDIDVSDLCNRKGRHLDLCRFDQADTKQMTRRVCLTLFANSQIDFSPMLPTVVFANVTIKQLGLSL